MVGTILPVVYRERSQRLPRTALVAYAAASVGAASLFGAVIGRLGAAATLAVSTQVSVLSVAAVAALCILYSGRELGLWHAPLWESHWQVPRRWAAGSTTLAFAGYGALLSLGVLTRMRFGTFYVTLACAMFLGDWRLGLLALGAYGAGRAAVVAIFAAKTRNGDEMIALSAEFDAAYPVARAANGLVMAGTAGWLLMVVALQI